MRKFYLKSGQAPPKGTTSIAMPDGGIVWIGEKWEAKDIENHEMDAAEIAEYEALLKFQRIDQDAQRIEFSDYLDRDKLAAKIATIKSSLDTVSAERVQK